jgi:hypothetical protein
VTISRLISILKRLECSRPNRHSLRRLFRNA